MEWLKDNRENLSAALKVISPLIIIILMWQYLPSFINKKIEHRFDSSLTAIIDSLKHEDGIVNTNYGSRITRFNYTIYYKYQIEDSTYVSSDFIAIAGLSNSQKAYLKNMEEKDSIEVLFKTEHPEKSKIKIQD